MGPGLEKYYKPIRLKCRKHYILRGSVLVWPTRRQLNHTGGDNLHGPTYLKSAHTAEVAPLPANKNCLVTPDIFFTAPKVSGDRNVRLQGIIGKYLRVAGGHRRSQKSRPEPTLRKIKSGIQLDNTFWCIHRRDSKEAQEIIT